MTFVFTPQHVGSWNCSSPLYFRHVRLNSSAQPQPSTYRQRTPNGLKCAAYHEISRGPSSGRHSLATMALSPDKAFSAGVDRDLDLPTPGFASIAAALEDMRQGKSVVVLDDEDRENEGDLIICAEKATTEAMAFFVNHTSGYICISMEGHDLDRLNIPLMVGSAENSDAMRTAFAITVDLREGTSTGISAGDRARTIRALADPTITGDAFRKPGHVVPLRYREGGVLKRPGHTEAAVDLARLAGCRPAAVLCEIVSRDGSMARTPELLSFAAAHGLPCITIADLIRYRLKREQLVLRTGTAQLPTRYGAFTAHSYRSLLDGTEHIALVAGEVAGTEGVSVAIQGERILADLFGAPLCDTRAELDTALEALAKQGSGALVYLRAGPGRGGGLADELSLFQDVESACSQSGGVLGGFQPDVRDYGVAVGILRDLGVGSARLLHSDLGLNAVNALRSYGLDVVGEDESHSSNGVSRASGADTVLLKA